VYPPQMNIVVYGKMLGQNYAYNLNSLVSIIVTLKCYVILRVYSYFSRWTSDTANSICNKYKVRAGIHFAIKAELKNRPYTMLCLFLLIILAICAFAIRTFEYYVSQDLTTKGEGDLQLLANAAWLILVTMTTVGYGDYFPKSHLGRLVGVVACILGMLLVSLIVVSLAIISDFTGEEKKAYSIIKKINADTTAGEKACEVIKYLMRLRMATLLKYKLSERFIVITQLKTSIKFFKSDYKIASSHALPVDEVLKGLEIKLKDDINSLSINVKKLHGIDMQFKSVYGQQKEVIELMDIISDRQSLIGRYMVDLNNENFKMNYLKYKKSEINRKNSKSPEKTNKSEAGEYDNDSSKNDSKDTY
jgi:hypothetical protein